MFLLILVSLVGLIFQPARSFHGLIWHNVLRVVAENLGRAAVAKNQREAGAHLMVASPEAADYCISLFSTNHIGCDTEIQRYESQTTRLSPTIGPFP